MHRVAAVLVSDDRVDVHTSVPEPVADELRALGAARIGHTFVTSPKKIEDVLGVLDRHGFVWALGDQVVPRLWAHRLFVELPPELHLAVYDALHLALDGADDHLSVLEAAWDERDPDAPGPAPRVGGAPE